MGALLGVALALRLWGVGYGLPHVYHPDESHEVFRALQLGEGVFNLNRISKGGYFYLLFAEYGAYYAGLRVLGAVGSPEDFAVRFIKDPTPFWLMGRITTALLGALSVYLVYRLAERAYSRSVAFIGAALLAVALVHVQDSHYITVNVPATMLVTATMLCATEMARGGSLRIFLLAGVCLGLAVQTKISVAVLLIPFLSAQWLRSRLEGKRLFEALTERRFALAALAAAGVYVVGAPGILFNGVNVIRSLVSVFVSSPREFIETAYSSPHEALEMNAPAWLTYPRSLLESLGAPAVAFCLIGFWVAIRRRRETDLLLLSFCPVYYAAIASSKTLRSPSYLDPILPFLAIFAGIGVTEALVRVRSPRMARLLLVLVSLLILAPPALASARFDYWISQKDTRTLAKEWIEANVPEGAKVLMDAGRFQTHRAPPIQESKENIATRIAELPLEDRGKVRFLELKMKHLTGKTYDVTSTMWGTRVEDLDYYLVHGFQYIVVSSTILKAHSTPLSKQKFPKSAAFYRAFPKDSRVSLVIEFPSSPNRPGPGIKIYKIVG